MSVSLSVVFTGLCALVGNGDGGPGDVLLLDATNVGQVRGVTLPPHAPTLVVSLNDLANPDSSSPTQVIVGRTDAGGRIEQLGVWDLSGSEIRIRAQGEQGTGLRFFRPAENETSWPEPPGDVNNPASWRDVRFVADMSKLVGDGRINPALVGGGDPTKGLPPSVAARILLDAGLLQASIPSQAAYREDVFEFRGVGSQRMLRQALTDTVQWTLDTEAAAIGIDITPVGGGLTKRLLLAPSAMPHRLYVSNLPVENPSQTDAHALHQAMSDAELAALHFGAYYNLLLNEPADRPLPSPWRRIDDPIGAGFIRPAACRPAMFSRP